ncbi:MAG: AzlC family ABC transporter permease [Clostridiales bacterium]|jgi:predicted branched-subunit amino acid permease|nr:AzlC family ABC transporter permease [Clostridiales bacterium]
MNGAFRKGIRHGLPIALGYLSVSFAFGMKAVGDGLTVLQAVLISMTNLTSAGQIAALPLMTGGAALTEMALTQLTINLRYALMSLSLSRKLDSSMGTLQRMIFSFANTDEIFAVASSQPGKVGKHYLYGLMLTPWFGWSLGTLLGAAAGTLLPAFVRTALGIAIYGMFLAIILPPARKQLSVRAVVAIAVALSLCFRYIPGLNRISSGFAIIICAVSAAAAGAALFPLKDGESE